MKVKSRFLYIAASLALGVVILTSALNAAGHPIFGPSVQDISRQDLSAWIGSKEIDKAAWQRQSLKLTIKGYSGSTPTLRVAVPDLSSAAGADLCRQLVNSGAFVTVEAPGYTQGFLGLLPLIGSLLGLFGILWLAGIRPEPRYEPA